MTLPQLALQADHRADLAESFDATFASLAKYLRLTDAKNDADMENARSVASALSEVVHSSDTDCEYFPCTLTGPDPTSDAFFSALGIARDARCKVSGWDNPKLDVARANADEGGTSTFALITRLSSDELKNVSDYLPDGDQKAIGNAATKLEEIGPVVGIQLCTDDGASKVLLTLARGKGGVYSGILTVRVET